MSDIVYRVQDKDGRGPWKPGFSQRWVLFRPDHKNLAPCYEEFGPVHELTGAGMHVGCGCKTVDQLRRWISPPEYQTLLEFGYKSVWLDGAHILGESDLQLVFERDKPLRTHAHAFDLYPTRPEAI